MYSISCKIHLATFLLYDSFERLLSKYHVLTCSLCASSNSSTTRYTVNRVVCGFECETVKLLLWYYLLTCDAKAAALSIVAIDRHTTAAIAGHFSNNPSIFTRFCLSISSNACITSQPISRSRFIFLGWLAWFSDWGSPLSGSH